MITLKMLMANHKQKYEITILNWDKHQRPLRGKGGAGSRRLWIAVSTNLDHDPDYLELKLLERHTWDCLLRHAGRVGPVFELSQSRAKQLFDLPRYPTFSLLEKQGFIELRVISGDATRLPTVQYSTVQNIPVGATDVAAEQKDPDKSVEDTLIWDAGVKLLGGKKSDRSHLGKLIRDHGKDQVAAAIATTCINRPAEPRSYLVAILQERPKNQSNLQQNVAVLQDWLNAG